MIGTALYICHAHINHSELYQYACFLCTNCIHIRLFLLSVDLSSDAIITVTEMLHENPINK